MQRAVLTIPLLALLAAALALFASGSASAIPSTVFHSHEDADVQWPDGAVAKPDTTRHNHRSANGFDQGDVYQGNAVWDNSKLRFQDAGTIAWGHGFITRSGRPRYCIDTTMPEGAPDFPAAAVERIDEAFTKWSSIKSDTQGLVTGLAFRKVDCPEGFIEIRVRFAYVSRVDPDNLALTGMEPTVEEDGTPKSDAQIANCSGFTIVNWPCLAEVKFEPPFKEGSGGADWSFSSNRADVPPDKYHFLTTALHEVGHVVGLSHRGDNKGVMVTPFYKGCPQNKQRPGKGPCFDQIDEGSVRGARDLYSIPVTFPCPDVDGACPVGGTVEFLAGGSGSAASPADASGPSVPYAAIATGLGAAALAVAAGGWYARRRWGR